MKQRQIPAMVRYNKKYNYVAIDTDRSLVFSFGDKLKYYINTNEAPEFSRIEKELTTDFGEYKKYRRLIMEAILTYLYDEVYIPSVSFRTLVIWVRRNYAETLKKLDLDELLKTNPEAYFCPVCNFSVRSLNELLTHFLLTHKEYRSICPVDNEPIHKPRYDIQHIPFFPFMYPDGIPDKISTIAIILAKYRFGTKAIKLQMERKNK